ncbi:MAG: phosphoenolpyruvate-utilizing N-terminal domain-containing protein, partial [Elusimicrobiota bacterium]
MMIKKGIPGSLGIAIGKAYILKEENILIEQKQIPEEEVRTEVKKFKHAIEKTKVELDAIKSKILNILGKQHAKLIDAHHLILQDPLITKEVPRLIMQRKINAEFALSEILDKAEQE